MSYYRVTDYVGLAKFLAECAKFSWILLTMMSTTSGC